MRVREKGGLMINKGSNERGWEEVSDGGYGEREGMEGR